MMWEANQYYKIPKREAWTNVEHIRQWLNGCCADHVFDRLKHLYNYCIDQQKYDKNEVKEKDLKWLFDISRMTNEQLEKFFEGMYIHFKTPEEERITEPVNSIRTVLRASSPLKEITKLEPKIYTYYSEIFISHFDTKYDFEFADFATPSLWPAMTTSATSTTPTSTSAWPIFDDVLEIATFAAEVASAEEVPSVVIDLTGEVASVVFDFTHSTGKKRPRKEDPKDGSKEDPKDGSKRKNP